MLRFDLRILLCLLCALVFRDAAAQCIQLPSGAWQCQPSGRLPNSEPATRPTAMDIRVEGPTSRGSGTAVARHTEGGTLVITNHHVIKDQSRIVLHNGAGLTSAAEIAATDVPNDLALLLVRQNWPYVNFGESVAVGTPVQFRAYDSGVRFRKYFGVVRSEYRSRGSGGFFASGASVPGNSGGGVYSQGRLVGVVWGNPDGGTAFVPVAPVRRLIEQIKINRTPQSPALPLPQRGRELNPFPPLGEGRAEGTPNIRGCDCERRWRDLRQAGSQPPALVTRIPWFQILAGAAGVSSPIGLAIVAAGWLLRSKRSLESRGVGGPRTEDFPQPQGRYP